MACETLLEFCKASLNDDMTAAQTTMPDHVGDCIIGESGKLVAAFFLRFCRFRDVLNIVTMNLASRPPMVL